MIKLFHKNKKTIDDIINYVNNQVYLGVNHKDSSIIIGFSEPLMVYGHNCSYARSPLRIFLDINLKITKIELDSNNYHQSNIYKELNKMISDIKIGDNFISSNPILMDNIDSIIKNYSKIKNCYENNICSKKINLEKYLKSDRKSSSFQSNLILL